LEPALVCEAALRGEAEPGAGVPAADPAQTDQPSGPDTHHFIALEARPNGAAASAAAGILQAHSGGEAAREGDAQAAGDLLAGSTSARQGVQDALAESLI